MTKRNNAKYEMHEYQIDFINHRMDPETVKVLAETLDEAVRHTHLNPRVVRIVKITLYK